jgi:hypothetical protein
MATAAGAGALAAVAQLLPATPATAPGAQPANSAGAGKATGYRLTEHVKRYYRTTLV